MQNPISTAIYEDQTCCQLFYKTVTLAIFPHSLPNHTSYLSPPCSDCFQKEIYQPPDSDWNCTNESAPQRKKNHKKNSEDTFAISLSIWVYPLQKKMRQWKKSLVFAVVCNFILRTIALRFLFLLNAKLLSLWTD